VQLQITLDERSGHAGSIYRQVCDAIRDGRLAAGERMPSSRELAADLRVARGTVTTVYDRLIAEGYLVSRRGAGTYVSAAVTVAGRTSRAARAGTVRPKPVWDHVPEAMDDGPPAPYDLSVGGPDPALFPLPVWRRMVSQSLRGSLVTHSTYDSGGHPELQSGIARYLGLSRSVQASETDVLLTNGAQQALDLCARVLVEPSDVVAVEDPGYSAAAWLFASHRARVIGVGVDQQGLIVDALPDAAKIIYVTPSHQFPTGAVMSLARRLALLDWAATHNAVIIEDDYDSEFRYADRPLEPLQSLDRDGRVIYVGSFSKIMLPMLRVGYLIAPAALQPALGRAKGLADWQGDRVTQTALARFLDEGLLSQHLRRSLRIYRERRENLLAAVDQLPGLSVLLSAAGLHICLRFDDPSADDQAVARYAAEAGVAVEPVSRRFVGHAGWPGLALGFGRIPADRIEPAIGRLATIISRVGPRPGSAG
jgi:GntR family transcriptional regulator/MocR family aminotransferase